MEDNRDIKEVFDKLLAENDTVFIVPHNEPDFDAIGSVIGISLIIDKLNKCKKLKKKSYIVINDPPEKIEPQTRKIIEELKGKFEVINADAIPGLLTEKSLMVAVDVNKCDRISTEQYLEKFNAVMVIDHHKTDEKTIKTPYLFVNEKWSSACEEIVWLLVSYKVKLSRDYATYLFAGIILDTYKLSKNIGHRTFITAAKLTEMGADPEMANNLFLDDFEHDRAIQRLIDGTDFPTFTFAIACDKDDSGRFYAIEDIAKAADYLLKYKVNASFAIARISEDTISISARSKGAIDIVAIMKLFGGGGNEYSAAARVKNSSISEIKKELIKILIPGPTFTQNNMILSNDITTASEEVQEDSSRKLVP